MYGHIPNPTVSTISYNPSNLYFEELLNHDLNAFSYIYMALVITAGSCFTVWIADLITQYGVGNGSSLIITVGIIAKVCTYLAENDVNILDISQTILDGMFTMMMIVDIENAKGDMGYLSDILSKEGESLGVDIRIQLESIFESMHRI